MREPVAAGMTRDDVLGSLARERKRLLDAVDALGPRADTASVTEPSGGWTAKDVLAHLIHYAGQIAFALGAELTPPAYVLRETARLTGAAVERARCRALARQLAGRRPGRVRAQRRAIVQRVALTSRTVICSRPTASLAR